MKNSNLSKKIILSQLESLEPFPVDFDDAWRWLGFSRKDAAKRNFKSLNFAEGIDYELHNWVGSDSHAGLSAQEKAVAAREEKIDLTIDCFKMWAMSAQTEKGKEVRRYYVEVEKEWKALKASAPQKSQLEILAEAVAVLQRQERELLALQESQAAIESRIEAVEAEQERIHHPGGRYFTVMGWSILEGKQVSLTEAAAIGRKATKACKDLGISIEKVTDPRFGRINAYPEIVLKEICGGAA